MKFTRLCICILIPLNTLSLLFLQGTLHLPNYQVLPEFLEPDEHVVVVVVGNLTAQSFVDTLPCSTAEKYSLEAANVAFAIPFLTGSNRNDPPHFKLVTYSYVSTNRPYINPHMAIPVEQVDKIVMTDNGVTMTDGDEYFSVRWEETEKCIPANYVIAENINEYLDELMFPFGGELDFSACDTSDVQDVHVCQAQKQMADVIADNKLNSCQYWTSLEPYTKCELESYTLVSISKGFQELSLIHEAPISPIVYEIQREAQFAINLKIPCM